MNVATALLATGGYFLATLAVFAIYCACVNTRGWHGPVAASLGVASLLSFIAGTWVGVSA